MTTKTNGKLVLSNSLKHANDGLWQLNIDALIRLFARASILFVIYGRRIELEGSITKNISSLMIRIVRIPGVLLMILAAAPLGLLAKAGLRDPAMRFFFGMCCRVAGVSVRMIGETPPTGSLVVANHVGYFDPVVIGVCFQGAFVAKSEIASWPLIGLITKWSGAVFAERDKPRTAHGLLEEIVGRLRSGERVICFPEGGVSPDGVTVSAFRPLLFDACVQVGRPVVPVALRYVCPTDVGAWAWIDETSLGEHFWRRALPTRKIEVELIVGEYLIALENETRKQLSIRARDAVVSLLGDWAGSPRQSGREI